MANINDSFFEGRYKEIWRNLIPEVLTEKETAFMVPYFGLGTSSSVLDLMCGYGRHSLALARQGISVTAVDNLEAYISEIRAAARAESLPVEAVQGSVTHYQAAAGKYDLVLCMGNSLNFFDAADVGRIFSMTASALKPGGHFLINSWSVAEIVFRNFKDSSGGQTGDTRMDTRLELKFQPARVEAVSTFEGPDGETETRSGIDYIYSFNELESMLQSAGLVLQEIYSIPGRKKFTLGEPRVYLVAMKP